MLEAFKIKEFDLDPIYKSWVKPPRFHGESKKDMPVEEFLRQIKAGCIERKVPEEYWHKVAQHYMGDKAKARLQELKSVMAKVNGGKYRWSWKKFTIAMGNMGWDIDVNVTEPVQVHSSGHFWLPRRKSMKDKEESLKEASSSIVEMPPPPPPKQARPNPVKMMTDSALVAATAAMKPRRTPTRANSLASTLTTTVATVNAATSNHAVTSISPPPDGTVTSISNAPTWLLNACHALNYLGSEHPRAMTTLSAVLITAGTLPAIPAISGGTVLATGVAQAVGAIAVGVGNLLKAQQEGQVQATSQQQPALSRASTFDG